MLFYLISSCLGSSHQVMQGPALELSIITSGKPTVRPAASLYLSNGKNEQRVLLY